MRSRRSLLLSAIRREDLTTVKALLARGASLEWSRWRDLVWRDEETPLQAAVTWRSPEITDCLLAHGADPDGGNPRHFAPLPSGCVRGDMAIIETLVAHGARIDGRPGSPLPSPLGVAVSRRNMALVEWLLAHDADPSTAFAPCVAIHQSTCAILARLIDAGAQAPADVERAVRSGRW